MHSTLRLLAPIRLRTREFDELENRIVTAFREALYWPLMVELNLPRRAMMNAAGKESPLLKAIQSGKVMFSGGVFSGKFTAAVSRELVEYGAKWDKRSGTYKLSATDLPPTLRAAIATAEARFQEKMAAVEKKLAQFSPADIAGKIRMADLFDSTIQHVEGELKKTLKAMSVPTDLTPERAKRLATEWSENLDLYIRDFADEEILNLRKDVQKSVLAGNRYEQLVGSIQKSYGVTQNKAKFLARQETNLMVTKFKEARYADAGVTEYKWQCVVGSAMHPVRPAHKKLDGKVFRFDHPPITSEPNEPQRWNNPGQDFNCRCAAIPIVRFKPKE